MARRVSQYLLGSPLQQISSAYVEEAILKRQKDHTTAYAAYQDAAEPDSRFKVFARACHALPCHKLCANCNKPVDPGRLLTYAIVLHRWQASQSRGQPKGDCFEGSQGGDRRSVTIDLMQVLEHMCHFKGHIMTSCMSTHGCGNVHDAAMCSPDFFANPCPTPPPTPSPPGLCLLPPPQPPAPPTPLPSLPQMHKSCDSYDSMLAQCKHQLLPQHCGRRYFVASGLSCVSRVCSCCFCHVTNAAAQLTMPLAMQDYSLPTIWTCPIQPLSSGLLLTTMPSCISWRIR